MSFQYMPLYTGDWVRDTLHLSPSEQGIYFRLVMHCWDQQGPAPLDERRLCGIVNARSSDEIEALRRVLAEYFVRTDDGYFNTKVERVLADCRLRVENAIRAGRASGEARRIAAGMPPRTPVERPLNARSTSVEQQLNQLTPTPTPTPTLTPTPEIQQATPARAPEHPECPHLEVLKVWSETLPALPAHSPALWRGVRQDHLRARWRETAAEKGWKTQAEGLAYFRKLFAYIGTSRFLTGRVTRKDDQPAFQAELEWVVKPGNWAKIIEGKYHAAHAV